MLAARMGLPVRGFVCGANANDVIPEFLSTGVYRPRPSVRTVANAMDVGAPSNYERLMCLYDFDYQKVISTLQGFAYTDEQIREAIREIYGKYSYVSDPHAAVAYMAYRDSKAEGFYLATAHPAKFPDVISDAFRNTSVDSGKAVKMPEGLAKAMKKEKSFIQMENDLDALEALI